MEFRASYINISKYSWLNLDAARRNMEMCLSLLLKFKPSGPIICHHCIDYNAMVK